MKFINKMIIKYVANIFDILKYVIVFKKIFALLFFHRKLIYTYIYDKRGDYVLNGNSENVDTPTSESEVCIDK